MINTIPVINQGCCSDITPAHTSTEAEAISDDFQIFASPVRVQILSVLARSAEPVCVCDLEAAVPVKQATVSYHLKLLRQAQLVTSERYGTWAFYALDQAEFQRRKQQLAEHLARWEQIHEHA